MAKIMRWFVALTILLACELGTAWAGAPKSIPKTLPGGAVLTPDTTHRCPPGGFLLYVFPDGAGRCLMPGDLPPRSQADCPPSARFTIMTNGWPECLDFNKNQQLFPARNAGEPAGQLIHCRSYADCPNGGVCYPIGGGICGSPPISR